MAVLDKPMQQLAKSLIDRFGGVAYLKRYNKDYEPFEGTIINKDPDSWKVKITPPEKYRINQQGANQLGDRSSVIWSEDLKCYVAAKDANLTEVPQVDWYLAYGGKEYRITDVETISAGDEAVLYGLTVVI